MNKGLIYFLGMQVVVVAVVVFCNPNVLSRPNADNLELAAMTMGVFSIMNGIMAKAGRIKGVRFDPGTQRIVAVIALALCMVSLAFNGGIALYKKSTDNWHSANAIITKLDFEKVSGKHKDYYHPMITVTYKADGNECTGVAVSAKSFDHEPDPSEYDSLPEKEQKFLPGKLIPIFFDPNNKSNIVLVQGLRDVDVWLLGIGAGLSGIGVLLSLLGFFRPARMF